MLGGRGCGRACMAIIHSRQLVLYTPTRAPGLSSPAPAARPLATASTSSPTYVVQ